MADTDPNTVPDTTDDILSQVDGFPTDEEAETPEAAEPEAAGEQPAEGDAPADEPAAEEDTPAAEGTEEAPAAEESDATSQEGEEKPAEEPATPAQPPAQPQPDPVIEARRQRETRLAAIKTEIAAINAKTEDEFDPFKDTKALGKLQAEKDELLEQKFAEQEQAIAAQQQQQQTEKKWQDWIRANPEVGSKGRDIFNEELDKALKKYGSAEAAIAVASDRWETRVNLIKGQARAAKAKGQPAPAKPGAKPAAKAPAKPAPPVTKGGGKVMPVGGAAARPAAPKDPEDVLVAGISDGVKGLLG
jgi:hypothetical protein